MSKFKSGDLVEVCLIDRFSDSKYFKGRADINNLAQMKLLGESLKEKGVVFPE